MEQLSFLITTTTTPLLGFHLTFPLHLTTTPALKINNYSSHSNKGGIFPLACESSKWNAASRVWAYFAGSIMYSFGPSSVVQATGGVPILLLL